MTLAGTKRWIKTYALLVLFVGLQFGYWWETHDIKPDMSIVPDPLGKEAVHALAFGDDQFFFRIMAFTLQNSGDTFGRFTALRYYNFNSLYFWFTTLDEFDARSNSIPAMASYYFAQTQNTSDVRYIADYLYEHAMRDVPHKWWWLLQTIYLAMHKVNDMDLAMKAATPLVTEGVPVWAQQMAAVVHEKRGEMEDALGIINTIKDNASNISDADLKFMTYFVQERIGRLDKMQSAADKKAGVKTEPAESPAESPKD